MLRHLEVLFDCQWVWSCSVFNLKRFSEHLFKVLFAQGFHSRPCQHGRVDACSIARHLLNGGRGLIQGERKDGIKITLHKWH